ncbi:MAG TPA: M12 family metallo-peptidase [Candidatus Binatia bacterium]|jgi:hypothetical protein
MITRRRITCFILSALFTFSCSLVGPKAPERLVRVKVLADVPFRTRNPQWTEEARGLVEAASDYYEREFEIRFVTESVAAWPAVERISSTPMILSRLQKEFPIGTRDRSYDLIVVFTGENMNRYVAAGRPRVDRIGDCQKGLASYVVIPISQIARYHGLSDEPELDVVALIHELGHVFGAEHVDDTNSIMHESFGYRTEFDAKNRSIIQKNRTCPFAQ